MKYFIARFSYSRLRARACGSVSKNVYTVYMYPDPLPLPRDMIYRARGQINFSSLQEFASS